MGTVVAIDFEQHRRALMGHCRRILGSPADAEDATQEALVRAWKGLAQFECRSSGRTWPYRIATNVCFDMVRRRNRMDQVADLPEDGWPESDDDPEQSTVTREEIRVALQAAFRHLPPRQRAVLILCDVLRWKSADVAALLETTVPAVNSARQRSRATLAAVRPRPDDPSINAVDAIDANERAQLARYVDLLARADVDSLVALVRRDAAAS